ncbi:hypothetical protein V6Z11_D09G265000 [Gossypium hirsutum]
MCSTKCRLLCVPDSIDHKGGAMCGTTVYLLSFRSVHQENRLSEIMCDYVMVYIASSGWRSPEMLSHYQIIIWV